MRTHSVELFLPELRLVLKSTRKSLLERLARVLDDVFLRRPVGPLPAATIVLECREVESQPLAPSGSSSRRLRHGYRSWGSPGRQFLGNGIATVEVREQSSRLLVRLDLRPDASYRVLEHLEYLIRRTIAVTFPRMEFYPLEAGVARTSGRAASGANRQVLLLGSRRLRVATLDALAGAGWETGSRDLVFLRRAETGIVALGAAATLPVLRPETILILADGPRHGDSTQNLVHHVLHASATDELALDALARREYYSCLTDLLAQVRGRKISCVGSDFHADIRAALTLLGVREQRGWDLPPPRTVINRRRPPEIPRVGEPAEGPVSSRR